MEDGLHPLPPLRTGRVFTHALQQSQASADPVGGIDWLVQIDSPLSAPTSTPPPPTEKRDQQAGRTRGNLITKIHLACDGRGQPLAILLSGR